MIAFAISHPPEACIESPPALAEPKTQEEWEADGERDTSGSSDESPVWLPPIFFWHCLVDKQLFLLLPRGSCVYCWLVGALELEL